MNLRQANRTESRIKMCLQGASGSGKTYSALLMGYGLTGDWKKICVVDSENGSSNLYSELGPYNVLGIGAPYTPEVYIEAIELAENAGMELIIIDSISQEWESILDIHSSMPGNSFVNWNKVNPRHNAFIQAILQSPAHIIATIRSKQDYVLTEKNGKMVPEKVGLKGVQRDGIDYNFTIVLDLDIKHNATASKDRSGLFMDQPPFVISEETGRIITDWCNVDENVEDKVDKVLTSIKKANTKQELQQIYSSNQGIAPLIKKELINRNNELKAPVNQPDFKPL